MELNAGIWRLLKRVTCEAGDVIRSCSPSPAATSASAPLDSALDQRRRHRSRRPPARDLADMEAASRTVFTCIRERTFCTCYGDWFPILCAPIAADRKSVV